MEDSNNLTNPRNFGFIGRKPQIPQNSNPQPNNIPHSASLDDLFKDEQPAWLDELLSEPASPKMNKGHRRSASDTSAYLNYFKEDDHVKSQVGGPSWLFQNVSHHDDVWLPNSHSKMGWKMNPPYGHNVPTHVSWGSSGSKANEKQVRTMKEGVNTKPDGSSGAKSDSKRIKHQNAHRARLRRLEYISDLERTIQVLQAQGCEMSSALHYFDQQLIILNMENMALKQRMENLAEIQKLKHVEQQFLEREIGTLKFRQQQQQQQQQPQQNHNHKQVQQNRYNKYGKPATQEPESQFAALKI